MPILTKIELEKLKKRNIITFTGIEAITAKPLEHIDSQGIKTQPREKNCLLPKAS